MEKEEKTTDGFPEQSNSESSQDLTGKTLGDFSILRSLGHGGMGQVYLAEQLSLKRKVALKLLKSELAANDTALKRFKAEAEAVARATHANIVQVYFIGEENGQHYMALEYVEGRNLRDYLQKKGTPDVTVCLSIMRQVASALQRASELGIIHRDIKPENILLTRKGEVKVTDFGLSRIFADDTKPVSLTQSGVSMGTPLYMSPEQVEGRSIDPRTDIYSFGVTCYHMLAGHPPFRGQTPFEVAVQHVQKEPPPLNQIRPDLPPEVCAVVHKMMAKDPKDRYQTCQEIIRDLVSLRDRFVGMTTGSQPLPGFVSSTLNLEKTDLVSPPPRQRSWIPWIAAASILLVFCASGALGIWWNRTNASSPDEEIEPVTPTIVFLPPESNLDREEELVRAYERFKKKQPKSQNDFRRERDACLDLAVFYLERNEWKKAAKFFDELDRPDQQRHFQYFGKLGKAIILGFQDQAEGSNKLFSKLFTPKIFSKKPPQDRRKLFASKFNWLTNPQFREIMAQALERNRINDPESFPPHLERFRHPPPLRPLVRKENGKNARKPR